MPDPGRLARLLARALWATRFVDRAYARFNRLRTRMVVSRATERFYDVYNDLAFGGQAHYRPGTEVFRQDLFPWEREAIEAWFPPPPATVLIGGAGGGREAIALARRGYAVTSFEPAHRLVASFLEHEAPRAGQVEAFVGRYEHLPVVTPLQDGSPSLDLSQRPRFAAAIFGWASFSNLHTDEQRIDALRSMAKLTDGPILLSYFPHHSDAADGGVKRGSFSLNVGHFRDLTEQEVREQAAAAAVDIVWMLHDTGWPRAIIRRRPEKG